MADLAVGSATVNAGRDLIGLDGCRHTVPTQSAGRWWQRLPAFLGPGYLVAVGYMDPGNWATDLAGGSAYGYALLWVVLMSSLMAMLLQVLAARLGMVAGMDLAQASRRYGGPRSVVAQWLLCELAICAADLAEVIGTAIALKLLFGVPLAWGVALTVLDVLLILWMQRWGFRRLEAVVISLLGVVLACFVINLVLAQPQWRDVLVGFNPDLRKLGDPGRLYIAIGIVGATVMPHNLYLHSSTVQTRRICAGGLRAALTCSTIDVVVALSLAFVINAAILVTAAATFHGSGHRDVVDLQQAYQLLGPITGSAVASVLFGLALLASGQSSALTATLAGQIVMEGFVRLRLAPWARRLLTRGLAIVPALCVMLFYGERGIAQLLLLSQVVLSLQLPFAVVPLIRFTSRRDVMGAYANPRGVAILAIVVVAVIVALNVAMISMALLM
ncbi:Nramp family divalent metal transporter [Cupriavidus sp. TMH.W2]|uniref:Nramp family divalent metal transporter n=1 Tax=Cupriavidus sp. TMH.W2 TaxID=3434465 RepID=UPI003D77A61E